jgi:hypothetical protein
MSQELAEEHSLDTLRYTQKLSTYKARTYLVKRVFTVLVYYVVEAYEISFEVHCQF